jgi:hypothetical protein
MDPIQIIADQLPGWTLVGTILEGMMGCTDAEQRTIWVDIRLVARQRRCTIMHEVVHAIHGMFSSDPDDELWVQQETARRLVSPRALAVAIRHSARFEDLLDALDVDLGVLRTRIRNLAVDEAPLVRRALLGLVRPSLDATHGCIIGEWWARELQPDPNPCDAHDHGTSHVGLIQFPPIRLPHRDLPALTAAGHPEAETA